MEQKDLDLAVIGNCAYSAVIDRKGRIVWSCFPRLDGDPIFCSLLKRSTSSSFNEIGFFDIKLDNFDHSEQRYLKNSAILSTKLWDKKGSLVEIIDFVPRFPMLERDFRPYMLVRKITILKGSPRICVRVRPTFGYGWGTPEKTRGSNHIRYLLSNTTIRLTTTAPISYIVDEVTFEPTDDVYLLLMPDESLKSPIVEICNSFFQKTLDHWLGWTSSLYIPFEWQNEVIRAAIILKLSNFEETGAFVAAMTTSIPTHENGENFDYRYCWVRDAYVTARILGQLGIASTLESYLRFLSNVVAEFESDSNLPIASVCGVSLERRIHYREMHRLPGYRGMGPVVLGVAEVDKPQHHMYGSLVLALSYPFFDQRIRLQSGEILFRRLEALGEEAFKLFDQKDYGPRGRASEPHLHTYCMVMCWVACDRLNRIATKLAYTDRATYWRSIANKISTFIKSNCWNQTLGSYVTYVDGNEVDIFLLRLEEVGFIEPTDPRFIGTVRQIEQKLKRGPFIASHESDVYACNASTFWYISALDSMGRKEEARKLFIELITVFESSAVVSETINPETRECWGNFPHNLGLLGLLNCSFKLSRPWRGAF